ncbi:MAG: hypothetical protein IANPNBLG_00284 [Bryobacteraceae bacterium]|nr:hypothetical protein [Bryobacteraceae bacterium]
MRVVLEILDGPLLGRIVELNPGQSVSVGRTAKSQLMLPHDSFLSGLHFQIECTETGATVKDCNSSNGTWVNGNKILNHALANGDQLAAGQTRFKIHLEEAPPAPEEQHRTSTVLFAAPKMEELQAMAAPPKVEVSALTAVQQAAVKFLQLRPAPLYAILNSNIEERVPHLLIASGEVYQFLSEGLTLGDQMPPGVYLVYLPATSPLLPRLVAEGWGKHWTLFFTCNHPFGEVRQHLRQFLIMQTEEGKRFFFRYYDPRLLQYLLPSCTPHEITQLFGPVQSFFMEDASDASNLIEMTVSPQGLMGKVVKLG